MTKIEEIEQKLNECQKALAELKESKKDSKWKPAVGEEYWLRNDELKFTSCINNCYISDDLRISYLPIFPTKEACARYWHFMDTVKEKSYSFSKEEWEDWDIYKYYVSYKSDTKDFRVLSNQNYKYLGQIYFKTAEDAQYIIDNFKDELMEYWI